MLDDFGIGRLLGQVSQAGVPLANLRPDLFRSWIFDDFACAPSASDFCSGVHLASLRPDSLRSMIFDHFETERLLG